MDEGLEKAIVENAVEQSTQIKNYEKLILIKRFWITDSFNICIFVHCWQLPIHKMDWPHQMICNLLTHIIEGICHASFFVFKKPKEWHMEFVFENQMTRVVMRAGCIYGEKVYIKTKCNEF